MYSTISAVYRVTNAGLNPLQLLLVGTVLEGTVLLCEIPTGLVADIYSRRLSIIIGVLLIGVGFLLEGLIPRFQTILLAQVLWGIGSTFTSGAENAWIADEVGETNVGSVYLRGSQTGQIGALVGTFLSVGLASFQLNLPIIVGGNLFIGLGIFLLITMPEQGFIPTPQEKRNSWQAMGHTLRSGVQIVCQKPVLITVLAISALYGMASEGFDRLWEVHLWKNFTLPNLGQFQPIVWFGIINAVAILLSIVAVEFVRRRVNMTSHVGAARALFTINILLIASLVTFGLAGNFVVAVVAYWAVYLLRAMNNPIYTAWLNQKLDPNVRATVFSASSQFNALGQIIGGPILGAIGKVMSIGAVMVGAGIVLSPVLLLYARILRRGNSQIDIQ
ncbi:tetracycline efflux MFS transporter TetA(P) [Calothrix sp. PCC 7716]|nr:tetracycline efflux MFS transporter TetA(P) [Calothrix sp. PCC 7716]